VGLKKLSQSILLSLAIFAGAAQLRAHSAPEAQVSPILSIATKQAPLQKKNLGFGFGAYLRHSARSLAGSFVAAVGKAQADRVFVLKKVGQPAKRSYSPTRATVSGRPKVQQTANAAACLSQQNEHRQPTTGFCHNLDLRPQQMGLFGFARLWNFTAIPPNPRQACPHNGLSRAQSGLSEASIAECASLFASYGDAHTGQPAVVHSLRAPYITAPSLNSTRPGLVKTPAAETQFGQTVVSVPGQKALLSAAADSNGIHPPLKEHNLLRMAASAQPWPRLG